MLTSPDNHFPSPGMNVQMVRAGSSVTIESRKAQGGQGVLYRGKTQQGAPVAVKWYRPSRALDRQRRAIRELAMHSRPHPAFAWPIDIVECPGIQSFGYVMQWVPDRFGSLIEMLRAPDPPSFRVIIDIALELVDAFAALHSEGLCYRDVNFGNLLVDPDRREVAIVDNDNIGTEGGDVFVKGTLRFMAPEVIRDEAEPSTITDLHSLAVFLFFLLMRGHPLEGHRVFQSYTWNSDSHISETQLAIHNFGIDPLFVFDPQTTANAPEPGSPVLVWWPIYPKFVRDLFIRAFCSGLSDASLNGRITEGEWRRAFMRLRDVLSECRCGASVFWDAENPTEKCWHCATLPPQPTLLKLPGRSVVLVPGATLTSDQIVRDGDRHVIVGVVERHPKNPNGLVLRNVSSEDWTAAPIGEDLKVVKPTQRLGIRQMTLTISRTTGEITVPPSTAPAGDPTAPTT